MSTLDRIDAAILSWSRRSMTGSLSGEPASSTIAIREVQYVSIKYTERLAEAGIEPSAGSVGDPYDCENVRAARKS